MLVSHWPQNVLQILLKLIHIISKKLFQKLSVDDHINNLKKGRATNLDGIGTRILKAGAPVVSIYFERKKL